MKQNRMVIAIKDDLVQILPFSALYSDHAGKIFCGKIEVAASDAVHHIRLLPNRRYQQLRLTKFVPMYYPQFYKAWILDAWHVSSPMSENSIGKIRRIK